MEGRESTGLFLVSDPSLEPFAYNPQTVYRSDAKYKRLKSILNLEEKDWGENP